jgi:hypothetical protein
VEPCGPVWWTVVRPCTQSLEGWTPNNRSTCVAILTAFRSGCPCGKRRPEHMDLLRRSCRVAPASVAPDKLQRDTTAWLPQKRQRRVRWNPLVSPRSKPGRPFAATSSRYHHRGSETTSPYPRLPGLREEPWKALMRCCALCGPFRTNFRTLSAPANSLQQEIRVANRYMCLA